MRFDELDLEDEILDGLEDMNFHEMTPVQEHTIPVILEGRDIIGCAQTGTGKTAAYTLPLLNKLLIEGNPDNVVKSLIIVPTRELAQQIDQQFQGFSYYAPLSTTVVYGGGDGKGWDIQKNGMLNGADVVIATPGRMIAHLQNSGVDLSHVEYLILDEADRMLDMGFFPDVKRIVKQLPAKRQTLLFSATIPNEIADLAESMLKNPVKISVTPSARPVEKIEQQIYFVEKAEKRTLLPEIIRRANVHQTLVFTRTKHGADRVARDLNRAGILTRSIHGDKSQNQRQRALSDFKECKIAVLVATDIAARGIDISELPLVINFDLPNIPETYVHRIGRTGRAGQEGTAISFCDRSERPYLADIEKLTGIRIPVAGEIPHDESKDKEKLEKQRRASRAAGRRRDTTSENASAEAVAEEAEREKQAKRKARTARAAASGKKPRREREQVKKQEQQAKSAAPRASRSSHRRRDPYARFEKNEPRFDAHTPSRAYALSDEASERIRRKVEAALAARSERLLNGDKAEDKPKKSARGGRSGRNGRGAHSKHPAQEAQAKTADAKPAAPRRHHRRRTPKKPQQQK